MAPILTRLGQSFGFGAPSGGGGSAAGPGMEATGGVISDYDVSGQKYRSHTFTNSGAFVISALSPEPAKNEVDYLIVGGGGGGGADAYPGDRAAGGGGAGGLIYAEGYTVSATGSWALTVGQGGSGGGYMTPHNDSVRGRPGANSVLTLPTGAKTAVGGGGGGGHSDNGPRQTPSGDMAGASGGGGPNQAPGGPGTGASGHPGGIDVVSPPTYWGNPGGSGGPTSPYTGGGGGGAATAGTAGGPTHGAGGTGARYTIANGTAEYYAGGGGGGGKTNQPAGGGGSGGGGSGSRSSGPAGNNGWPGKGGGGGAIGAYNGDGFGSAYKGGDGAVIIRYKIADSDTDSSMGGTNQATGGLVSYYGGKTIHAFLWDGVFSTQPGFSKTVEYFMIAGGGSGANGYGGAGGAGGYYANDPIALGPNINLPVVVGDGGKNAYRNSGDASNQGGRGMQGRSTTVNWTGDPKSAAGGGWGQSNDVPPNSVGGPGGSGGGGGVGPGGSGNMANPGPNSGNGYGNIGGAARQQMDANYNASGGGGGAGGAGMGGNTSPATAPGQGGPGGIGIQLPTTFRDPRCTLGMPGPGGTKWWVGGGGGGGHGQTPYPAPRGGGGPGWNSPPISGTPDGVTIPWAGGGNGAGYIDPGTDVMATNGHANTGGGGGGCGRGGRDGGNPQTRQSGAGGSGLVLIAYPT